jgi:hypothetical protein
MEGKKIICNKVLLFYDSGDNKVNVIKIKKEKCSFDHHTHPIIDFTIPPKSTNEIFSIDASNSCLRWLYNFKDELKTGLINKIPFLKPMTNLLTNQMDKPRILASWSEDNIAFTYFFFDASKNLHLGHTLYVPTVELTKNPIRVGEMLNTQNFKIEKE